MKKKMLKSACLLGLATFIVAGCAKTAESSELENVKNLGFIGCEVVNTDIEKAQRDKIVKELKNSKDTSKEKLNLAFNNALNNSGIIIVTTDNVINNKHYVNTVNAAEFGNGYLNVVYPDSSYISYVKTGDIWKVTSYPSDNMDKEISNYNSIDNHGLELFLGTESMKLEVLGDAGNSSKDKGNVVCFVNQSGAKGIDYTMNFTLDNNNITEIFTYVDMDYKDNYNTKTEIKYDTDKNISKARSEYQKALKTINNPIFEKEILGE